MDADVVFILQMLCQMLRTIDRAVLSAGAAEGDLEIGEIALYEACHMMINEGINGLQEGKDLAIRFEKIDDGLVETGHLLVLLVLTRIMGPTTIKDIPASVTGRIFGDAALKGEGVDRY